MVAIGTATGVGIGIVVLPTMSPAEPNETGVPAIVTGALPGATVTPPTITAELATEAGRPPTVTASGVTPTSALTREKVIPPTTCGAGSCCGC